MSTVLQAVGTSEGALKGWDTRGRNRTEQPQKEHALAKMLMDVKKSFGDNNLWAKLIDKGHIGKVERFTPEEKQHLALLKDAVGNCKVGYCVMNAQRLATSDEMMHDPKLQYVEGLATVHGVPIDHAWVEINGKVYDPTLNDARGNPKGKMPPGEYFGVNVPKDLIRPHQYESGRYEFISHSRDPKEQKAIWGDRATIKSAGTSEGADKGWDTRGRGRHESSEFVPSVRRATKEDFKELKEWYQKWGEPGSGPMGARVDKMAKGSIEQRQAQSAQLADQIGSNASPSDTFVVQGKDGIVGAMQLDTYQNEVTKFIEVDLLCAHPEVISGKIDERGVGTRLMLQAAKVAAAMGKGIQLNALENARPFYQKLGMHQLAPGASNHYWKADEAKAMAEWDQRKH